MSQAVLQCTSKQGTYKETSLSGTSSWSYLDMCHLVVVEVAGCREPLSADAALVRLLAAVDPPVRVERGRRGEPLRADVAHVRPLSGVDAHVTLQ